MPNLFRTGVSGGDCSYELVNTLDWCRFVNGLGLTQTNQYPIFNNKNIDVLIEYSTPYKYETSIVLLDESKNEIKTYTESYTKNTSLKVDLTSFPTAKYFNMKNKFNISGSELITGTMTIKVY